MQPQRIGELDECRDALVRSSRTELERLPEGHDGFLDQLRPSAAPPLLEQREGEIRPVKRTLPIVAPRRVERFTVVLDRIVEIRRTAVGFEPQVHRVAQVVHRGGALRVVGRNRLHDARQRLGGLRKRGEITTSHHVLEGGDGCLMTRWVRPSWRTGHQAPLRSRASVTVDSVRPVRLLWHPPNGGAWTPGSGRPNSSDGRIDW